MKDKRTYYGAIDVTLIPFIVRKTRGFLPTWSTCSSYCSDGGREGCISKFLKFSTGHTIQVYAHLLMAQCITISILFLNTTYSKEMQKH